jgi:hypothetical protein
MLMKYKDFKTMSSAEMKEIKGGSAPAGGNCGQFETTYICGSNVKPNGTCTVDYCYCSTHQPIPGGCEVPYENCGELLS